MIQKALQYLVSLKKNEVVEIDGKKLFHRRIKLYSPNI